ncbi:hypothetical protein KBC03_03210 [Patescibacteria group bacterium]|nr:hypothetical protein [Patescibacteria group bacterium]
MNHMDNATVRNTNGVATAALIFALIAAAFSALTYFTLPAMVQRGIDNAEAVKVGGPEKYAELKQIYMDNAAIFGEQVDQIKSQIEIYKQMQSQSGSMNEMGISGDEMPATDMMMTGDEAASQ